MEFVSKMTRIAKSALIVGVALGSYLQTQNYEFRPNYLYEHIAEIRRLDVKKYAGNSTVAFTNAKDEIAMPDPSQLPYENGIHSGPFVLEHEITHIEIEGYKGVHDERGINAHVRSKFGYSRDPFPSY